MDVLYPQDCVFCERPASEGGHICVECLKRFPLRRNTACSICGAEGAEIDGERFVCLDCQVHRPAFKKAFIVARYDGAMRDLIQQFKYNRGLWLLSDLTRFMVAHFLVHLKPLGVSFNAVVAVPMQRAKFRLRGYNQADLLARSLSRALHIPYVPHALRRVQTQTSSQTRLHRSERLRNARASYRASCRNLQGMTVLLVDDVMTTGATCDACAAALKRVGAKRVYVLALARPYRPYGEARRGGVNEAGAPSRFPGT